MRGSKLYDGGRKRGCLEERKLFFCFGFFSKKKRVFVLDAEQLLVEEACSNDEKYPNTLASKCGGIRAWIVQQVAAAALTRWRNKCRELKS